MPTNMHHRHKATDTMKQRAPSKNNTTDSLSLPIPSSDSPSRPRPGHRQAFLYHLLFFALGVFLGIRLATLFVQSPVVEDGEPVDEIIDNTIPLTVPVPQSTDIFVLTTTAPRNSQRIHLLRLAYLLSGQKGLHWFVIENSDSVSGRVHRILNPLPFHNLTTLHSKREPETKPISMYNEALEHVRKLTSPDDEGFVYFTYDDLAVDPRLFRNIRMSIQDKVVVFPIAFVNGFQVETPLAADGEIVDWHFWRGSLMQQSQWHQHFHYLYSHDDTGYSPATLNDICIRIGSFAIPVKLLHGSDAVFTHEPNHCKAVKQFLAELGVTSIHDLQVLNDNTVRVWNASERFGFGKEPRLPKSQQQIDLEY